MFTNLKAKNLCLSAISLCLFPLAARAQIIPDGTTATTVTADGDRNIIQGGNVAGGNLFHSFSDFSLPNGGEARFNNAADIDNIISRVTGGRISAINGIIGANGGANLFLLNPAGIILGNNASLQIGGSFLGSTADSLIFSDGTEFNATDSQTAPILTVNAPIGLRFRDNPADIQLQGASVGVRLGQNLTLVGGNINLTGGSLFARDGKVALGAVLTEGVINLDENFSLGFDDNLTGGDISLSSGAIIDVSRDGSGSVEIDSKNLSLTDSSLIAAGINPNIPQSESVPGNIVIDASETVSLAGESAIRNNIGNNSQGNTGNISVTAADFSLTDNSRLSSIAQGQGNTGNIVLDIARDISLENSRILNRIGNNGVGNAGDIQITADTLTLEANSSIASNTAGVGNAGRLSVNVAGDIAVENSTLTSQVLSGGRGNANNIEINTSSLSLIDAQILGDSNGVGDAGNVMINATGDVSLDRDTIILSKVSEGEGNGRNVEINSDRLLLDGRSFIISNTGDRDLVTVNRGNAGDVIINSRVVSLDNFSQITSNALSNAIGEPGNIKINTDTLQIAGGSNVNALTENDFDGGSIAIAAQNLELTTGGKIVTATNQGGNGGDINIDIAETITIDGSNAPTQPEQEQFIEQILQDLELETGLFANATAAATGSGGNIMVKNPIQIDVVNNGTISAASEGRGSGGSVFVQSDNLELDNEGTIEASTVAGVGGNINLIIEDLLLMRDNGNQISARAAETANGGNVNLDTRFIVGFVNQNNDIIANARQGQGGNIEITAEAIFGLEQRPAFPPNTTNDIDASSEFGLDGRVSISTPDVNKVEGITELPSSAIDPEQSVAKACGAEVGESNNSLSVSGKGGIPRQPIEPLIAETIIVDGNSAPTTVNQRSMTRERAIALSKYPPVLTAQGSIYPARGIMVDEQGRVILTPYPNPEQQQRDLERSQDCLRGF